MQDIFSFIIHPMELGLTWLAVAVGNAGIGIILFTIFVRLVLGPLQIAQLRSSRSMQRIQPLVAELRKKHGKDRVALQQEMSKLYKEHNVNPAMGCLPTLVQFPILIGLFYALLHLGSSPPAKWPDHCSGFTVLSRSQWFQHCYSIKGVSGTEHVWNLFHANFLWLSHGLGQADPLYILPILAGVTQWVQSRMLLTRTQDPQQQMMNTMMNFVPFMIVFFALRYPSGLSLYWVTSTVIAIAIQYRITGMGLLPKPATILAFARQPGVRSPRAQTRNTSSRQKRVAAPPPPAKIEATPEVNGQNGAAGGTNGARPVRKKANRARGGKGGRRG